MRIVIPINGERVSPRIDCAGEFVVVETDEGTINGFRKLEPPGPEIRRLYDLLVREDIDLVLCGGIGREDRLVLEAAGIEVNWGWMGDVEDILNRFITGHRNGSIWAHDGRNGGPN